MDRFRAAAQPARFGRRTLWIAALAIGLVLAWVGAAISDGGGVHILADGVVRSDAVIPGKYKITRSNHVYTVRRDGKVWAVLVQGADDITLADPEDENNPVVVIRPAGKQVKTPSRNSTQ
jgi:hypothetical protein